MILQKVHVYLVLFLDIVPVRMTTERRTEVQEHAANMGESTTAFINRAIDETMSRDGLSDKE